MSEKQRREQLKMIQRAIDEYYSNRLCRDELGAACRIAFELLIKKDAEEMENSVIN